jgi:hypothetical protein
MKVRILFLLGGLVLVGCDEPKISSDETPNITPAATPRSSARSLYLTERVAVATDESLYGLETGTELKLIEERPTSLLVEAEGMQFEVDPRQTTHDRDLAGRLLAQATDKKNRPRVTIIERWQIEDRRFLAEENFRRSAAEEAHLRNAVNRPRR